MIQKKNVRFITITAMLMITFGIVLFIWQNTFHQFSFYIDEEEISEWTITMEYGEEVDLSPKALHLTARKGTRECEIQYEVPKISELKTYQIHYTVEGEALQFLLNLQVEDHSAPRITGELTYSIKAGEPFDISHLNLLVEDNFDQDIKLQMEDVDTSEAGTQEIEV